MSHVQASQIFQIDAAQLGVFVQIEEPPGPMDGLCARHEIREFLVTKVTFCGGPLVRP